MKFLVNGTALLRYTDIQHCISLRCTMCWIDTLTYCKMITTMVLANTSITSHIYYYIFVVKTFKIYSLSNFHIYNTVLSVITMLYTSDPQLIHLITGSLSVWPTFLHAVSQPSQPLVTTILDCFCEFEFLDLTYRWYYTVAVFLWFITISIMPSRPIHIVTSGRTSFFPMAQSYSIVYIYLIFFIHSSVHEHLGCFRSWLLWIMLQWTRDADTSLRPWFHFLWIYTQKWNCFIVW